MDEALDEAEVTLPKKFLKGSKFRFLMLTSIPREQVAATLTQLVSPLACVDINDNWMPRGFLEPEEGKLGECPRLLPRSYPKRLTDWWLKVPEGANTPNWDLVSTCKISGETGLILVEGKAHSGELHKGGKETEGNRENHCRIKEAIEEAKQGLSTIIPGWHLSRDSYYQLSNRFAWAWKVATLGIPTILIYLGFLRATEMKEPFASAENWNRIIREEHASSVVPKDAWGRCLQTSRAPLWALIRSIDLQWVVARQVTQ